MWGRLTRKRSRFKLLYRVLPKEPIKKDDREATLAQRFDARYRDECVRLHQSSSTPEVFAEQRRTNIHHRLFNKFVQALPNFWQPICQLGNSFASWFVWEDLEKSACSGQIRVSWTPLYQFWSQIQAFYA